MNLKTASVPDLCIYCRGTIPGHFIMSPKDGPGEERWLHSPTFLDFEQLTIHPSVVKELAARMAERIMGWRVRVGAIIGPERGATTLSCLVALELEALWGTEVLAIVVEKNGHGGYRIHPRNLRHLENRTFAALDDVVTRGTAMRQGVAAGIAAGGKPVGAVTCWDRSGEATPQAMGVSRFSALCSDRVVTLTGSQCLESGPCKEKMDIRTDYGHGAQYLEEMRIAKR